MKRILASAAVIVAAGAFLVLTLGSSNGGGDPTYRIQLDNAFGLVNGADFKVAGVIAGSMTRQEPSGPATTVVVVRYRSLVPTSTPAATSASLSMSAPRLVHPAAGISLPRAD